MSTRRSVGLSGIAVVVLFGVGNALWAFDVPDPGASAATILAFYRDNADRIVLGDSLALIAIALFVYFASGLRRVLAEADGDELWGTVAFGGAMLGLAAGLGAETINMVGGLRAHDGSLDASLARSLFEISQVLGFNAAGVGVGVLGIATAVVALRTGQILPRWLAGVTLVVGLALLTPLSRFVFGPGVLLLAVVAAFLLRPEQDSNLRPTP